jgi:hypothetical protein
LAENGGGGERAGALEEVASVRHGRHTIKALTGCRP